MAKIQAKTKENPKLQQKALADGRQSLYLEYYMGYNKVVDENTGKEKIKHIEELILVFCLVTCLLSIGGKI